MGEQSAKINEVDFCGQVASWANAFLADTDSPSTMAAIEGYGSGTQSRKRKDLRLLGRDGKLAITGEVRLPGSKDGDSPYGPLADNAFQKPTTPELSISSRGT